MPNRVSAMRPSRRTLSVWLPVLVGVMAGVPGCAPPPRPMPMPAPGPVEPAAAPQEQPRAEPVVTLVCGTSSLPSPAERNYARTLAERMARWLEAAGVPCALLDDEAVARGAAAGARVVVLCYNPRLPAAELAALRLMLRQGGKLVVFMSEDPNLAALMRVQVGELLPARRPGQWHGYRFLSGAPAGAPERVLQEARRIRPVRPADGSGRVLAQWEDSAGTLLAEPAWVQTPLGLWSSYVLLEGDVRAKQRMLLAFLGQYAPAVWEQAAEHAARNWGAVGYFSGTADALESISRLAAQQEHAAAQALVTRARSLGAGLPRERSDAAAAWRVLDRADLARATLLEAYARLQPPRAGEFRGVWNHSGLGLYPGDWQRTCRLLAESGITAVFPNVLRPGAALYPSRVVPRAEHAEAAGDPLAQCLAAARSYGVEVHAWVLCGTLDGAPDNWRASLRRQGRLQVSAKGTALDWLCPSHPDNVKLVADMVRELARAYPVDGIHLDYVRYPSADACYCAGCRRRFESELGRAVTDWPAAARRGALAERYRAWRRRQITGWIRAAREALRTARPGAKLSVAVYPTAETCRDSIGQDWAAWLRAGYVDFVCPMDYATNLAVFGEMVRGQMRLPAAQGRIFPGIGVTAREGALDAAQTIDQMRTARAAGAAGVMLFDLNFTLGQDILPYLRLGLTADAIR